MKLNKPQAKFEAEIWKLALYNIKVGFNPIVHVTTKIKIDGLTPDEVTALRKKIYDLEITLMASDPDTNYDFSAVTE